MRHLSPRRLTSLVLSVAILAIPTVVLALTAAPHGCGASCAWSAHLGRAVTL